jgi:asparagine synthase (glutamine-hydrolysing)
MVQRGPDDDGFFEAGSTALGFRRLSIVDVAGGHQPLLNENGDLHLVLNGEIYNHVELRQQLIARGHVFRTASDAEVVLHLYEDRGVEALTELNGMFAFALHDARRGAVWIARDRLGIKPLFYSVGAGRLAFASDIRALRAAQPSVIDRDQVVKYLAFGYVPGGDAIWSGVRKLPPAHYLWIEGGEATTRRYWDLPRESAWSGTAADAQEQLEALLRDAVRLELRSDVPLGVFLSGGVDSSAIVALAAEQLDEPLRTFTIRFEGKDAADERFARTIAERYRTAHTEIAMDAGDAAIALDELLPLMDEPIADSAFIPAYWLSKAARDRGIKVLLNGAGGDEVFGGYRRHSPARFGSPTWVAENLPFPVRQVASKVWGTVQPHRGLRAANPSVAWAATVSGVNLGAMRGMLRDPADYAAMMDSIRETFQVLESPARGDDYAHRRMRLDLETYLPEDILALTDKATMAASVEGRVPFVDHRIVEFGLSLPAEINLLDGEPKGLLKRMMATRLPAELMYRAKEGFNAPDDVWFGDDSRFDVAAELLEMRTPVLDDLLNPRVVESILGNPTARSRSAGVIFSLFLFNRWLRAQALD